MTPWAGTVAKTRNGPRWGSSGSVGTTSDPRRSGRVRSSANVISYHQRRTTGTGVDRSCSSGNDRERHLAHQSSTATVAPLSDKNVRPTSMTRRAFSLRSDAAHSSCISASAAAHAHSRQVYFGMRDYSNAFASAALCASFWGGLCDVVDQNKVWKSMR